jgi:hypothetical protein
MRSASHATAKAKSSTEVPDTATAFSRPGRSLTSWGVMRLAAHGISRLQRWVLVGADAAVRGSKTGWGSSWGIKVIGPLLYLRFGCRPVPQGIEAGTVGGLGRASPRRETQGVVPALDPRA